jgi:hypothetical protein
MRCDVKILEPRHVLHFCGPDVRRCWTTRRLCFGGLQQVGERVSIVTKSSSSLLVGIA